MIKQILEFKHGMGQNKVIYHCKLSYLLSMFPCFVAISSKYFELTFAMLGDNASAI